MRNIDNKLIRNNKSFVRFVRATYGVASAYVLADTVDKASKMNKEKDSDSSKVALAAFDTLVS